MDIFRLSKGSTMKYVALTSGRNEEKFIRHTVEAVLALDPPPVAYVVVDDASTITSVMVSTAPTYTSHPIPCHNNRL